MHIYLILTVVHIYLILTLFECKYFFSVVKIDSSNFPVVLFFIEKIQSETFSLFLFHFIKFKLPVKAIFQNLDNFTVIVSFFFVGECFEGSMKRLSNLETAPHTTTWNESRFIRCSYAQVVYKIFYR